MTPKFLAIPKRTPSFFSQKKAAATAAPGVRDANTNANPDVDTGLSSALKIIHAGGRAEIYYMAVPAVSIMNKYPSFLLARPEIFRRPWDSLVHPEEILMPGERYFVVPQRTVKKLLRRIPQTSILHHVYTQSSISWQSISSSFYSVSKSKSHKDVSIASTVTTSHPKRSRKKTTRKPVKWDPKLTIIYEGTPS